MITLDPDFETYAVLDAKEDGSGFTFVIHDEKFSYGRTWDAGAVERVECFNYSNIRGRFEAIKQPDGKWVAERLLTGKSEAAQT